MVYYHIVNLRTSFSISEVIALLTLISLQNIFTFTLLYYEDIRRHCHDSEFIKFSAKLDLRYSHFSVEFFINLNFYNICSI